MQSRELYEFEKFVLDVSERTLSHDGEPIRLTEKVFDTLTALVRRPNRLSTKEELMSEIWSDSFVEENNLDKNISLLRKVLESKDDSRTFIETVRGHGYRFASNVRPVSESAGPPPTKVEAQAHVEKHRLSQFWFGVLSLTGLVVIALVGWYLLAGEEGISTSTPPSGKISRIAVLPFKPLISGDRNEALELGMSDALIDKLNGAEGIIVTPLSSVRRFGSLEQDPTEAGRQLEVDAVLDGSIQTDSDRIRISVRLLQVQSRKQLWSQQFDEKLVDIFSVQDSISQRVADALKVRLGVKKHYTENAEAYGLYLKARYLSQRASLPELRSAVGYLETALKLDPNFVPAYVVMADVYRATVLIGDEDPAAAMPIAKNAALKAVTLDDNFADAHAALGWTIFWYDRDWPAAETELRRAIELDPRSSDARQYLGHLLSNTGRHADALSEIDKALEIEPLSLRANAFRGMFLNNAGRNEDAVAQFRKTLELQPDFRLAQMFLARALIDGGRYDEALANIDRVRSKAGDAVEPKVIETTVLALLGRKGEAEQRLETLLQERRSRYVSNYGLATIYAAMGQKEEAINRLEISYRENDLLLVFLSVDRRWDGLRSEPRFKALMQKLNLLPNVALPLHD